MVKYTSHELDSVFRALSDSTRRGMLSRLAKTELSVSELAAPYDMSLAAVSKHLKVLEAAHFIERTKEGRTYRCKANLAPLDGVTALLEELGAFWRGRLDTLAHLLEKDSTKKGETK